MPGPLHSPAEPTKRHPAAGLRTPAELDCHLADQQLLAAMRDLAGTGPMTEGAWNVLRQAARRGDLFIVTREAGDSEHRYARMQKGRRGR